MQKDNASMHQQLLESFPHFAIIINRDRVVLNTNKMGCDIGVKVGTYCWDSFVKLASIPEEDRDYFKKHNKPPKCGTMCSFCEADQALDLQKPIVSDVRIGEAIWETHWRPLDKEKYLHFALDVTENRKMLSRSNSVAKLNDLLIKTESINKIGIWEQDLKTQRLQWSNKVYQILGLKPGEIEMTFEEFLKIVHPDDRNRVIEETNLSSGSKKSGYSVEYRTIRPDGEILHFHEYAETALDNSGKPAKLVGTIYDITELKMNEKRLKDERDKAQQYLDIVGVMILALNTKGEVTLVNKKGCEILGHKEEDIVGKNWIENFIPERQKKAFEKVAEKLVAGDIKPVEYYENEILDSSGREKLIAWHNSTLFDGEGKVIGIIASGEDITKRKKTEKKLVESECRYRSLAESATEAIITIDAKGKILSWNRSATTIFGYKKNEVIGKPIDILIPERFKESHKKGIKNYLTKDKARMVGKRVELEALRKDGTEFPLELSISTWAIDDELFFSAIIQDITEKKAMELQLINSEKLNTIGTFVSGVAHELNNPLTAVMGFSERLIERHSLNGESLAHVNIIKEQAKRAAEIVKSLLKFARKYEPGKTVMDLRAGIENVLSLHLYRLKNSDIQIIKKYSKEDLNTLSEGNQLQQVFLNIILNGQQAMTEAHGKGTLTISTMRENNNAVIIFENDGEPISETILSKIFDPFFTTKKNGEGTGLGLSISNEIIKSHGGSITVENTEETGVRFKITLPLLNSGDKAEKAEKEKNFNGREKILLVEDEDSIRKLVESDLIDGGYKVITANNGKEAQDLMETENFDIVLCDQKMPIMDGISLFNWIRRKETKRQTKFLLTTGDIDEKMLEYCDNNNLPYILKPYEMEDVLKKIGHMLGSEE